MARYTGPKSKIARKFREPIFGPDKALEKKPYPPGMHGNGKRRQKKSDYAVQLQEKQKAKYTYGILEKQFLNLFKEASRRNGITGENLLMLCESRLDNTIFRLGISPSRRGARQLVSHKHVTVNGEVVNIPSYQLKSGDIVAVREKSKSLDIVQSSIDVNSKAFPWLEFDKTAVAGKFLQSPLREDIPENINTQLIVELYSK
ncbi:MAG: 30S ribosomal protein S4 [Flavobacteriales bacterium]|nr:30S ribosomal protein S4 [Flavobacteriales bacterium]|tara:strand:- start:394 stop:999 length:606 start_codon:yes stop_codon:yes gene_type:complete